MNHTEERQTDREPNTERILGRKRWLKIAENCGNEYNVTKHIKKRIINDAINQSVLLQSSNRALDMNANCCYCLCRSNIAWHILLALVQEGKDVETCSNWEEQIFNVKPFVRHH